MPVSEWAEAVSEFKTLLGWGEFATSIPLQARAIATIRKELGHIPQQDLDFLLKSFAESIGRSEEWVLSLLTLNAQDTRRALRSPVPHLDRLPGEEHYPNQGWLGAYLLYTQEGEAPLGWQFWVGVTVLGVVLRKNFYWDRGRYYLYPNHYTLLLGNTGLKKSTSIVSGSDLLRDVDALVRDEVNASGFRLPRDTYVSPDRITPERLMQDLSSKYVIDPATSTTRPDTIGLILADELVSMLGRNVHGADRMVHFLTDVYGGKRSYKASTLTGGDRYLFNVCLSCLFGSTAEWVRTSITEDLFAGGFMARMVVIPRKDKRKSVPEPPPADPIFRHQLAKALVPWVLIGTEVEFRRSREADEWYRRWYEGHQAVPVHDPKLAGYKERKDDHLHKLAGILEVSRLIDPSQPDALDKVRRAGQMDVSLESFLLALSLLEDEERRLPEVFAEVGESEEARIARRVWEALMDLQKSLGGPVPHSLLLRKTVHFVGSAKGLRDSINTLKEQGLVESKSAGTGVRYLAVNKG